MMHLLPGLRKFSEEIFPSRKALFQSLSEGQKPHTLFITCSDSRIDPNLVTQTNPGEIFILRNAGNIVPAFGASQGGEEAAIEFAIEGLQVSNVVICGHSHCGAMAALIEPTKIDHLPSVKRWLKNANATKRRIQDLATSQNIDLRTVIKENILVQVNNLKTHPAVSAAIKRGQIRVFGWMYDFESGSISVYDPSKNVYVPSKSIQDESNSNMSLYAL